MHFLFDADSLVYAAGFAGEKREYLVALPSGGTESFQYKRDAAQRARFLGLDPNTDVAKVVAADPLNHVLHTTRKMVEAVENNCINSQFNVSSFKLFLTGGENFRELITPDYKANRDPSDKPYYYEEIRKYLIKRFGAEVTEGIEADDEVSIRQTKYYKNGVVSCIISQDKDLNTVPGWHYNYRKNQFYFVSDKDAITFFYCQLLMGDKVDNIKGVKGYGPFRTYKALMDLYDTNLSYEELEKALYERVLSIYEKAFGDDARAEFFINASLLWMLREENVLWSPPV